MISSMALSLLHMRTTYYEPGAEPGFCEQVTHFHDAAIVIGLHGAHILGNAMFMSPSAELIEIVPTRPCGNSRLLIRTDSGDFTHWQIGASHTLSCSAIATLKRCNKKFKTPRADLPECEWRIDWPSFEAAWQVATQRWNHASRTTKTQAHKP